MAPTNMSIQPGSNRPPMKQEDHPDHNMPPSEYDGDTTIADMPVKTSGVEAVNRAAKGDKLK